MSVVSLISFGVCCGIGISCVKRNADILSPSRVFGFTWGLAIGLADLKLSALQHSWTLESWMLLLLGIGAFLAGTFIAFVVNLDTPLVPVSEMRERLSRQEVVEKRLFLFVCLSVAVYGITYLVSYLLKGFLPVFAVGKISRVEFNVYGFGIFVNSTAFIMFFAFLYFMFVKGKPLKKAIIIGLAVIAVASYFLLLQRFQIMMGGVICFALLYYANRHMKLRTVLVPLTVGVAFFYFIMTLRLGNLLATITYFASKMRIPIEYAFLTEPYMYVVMNLENFAHSVMVSEYYTYGYFTFDFVPAIMGLKYWILEYFNWSRTPYLTSYYNTYTAFWWFYSDFGVIGLALIPLSLGLGIGLLYYRMRSNPTIKRVAAYGIFVFIMLISFFVFPIAHLWFEYNVLAFYLILRWSVPSTDRAVSDIIRFNNVRLGSKTRTL